jgi:hypothetical protein
VKHAWQSGFNRLSAMTSGAFAAAFPDVTLVPHGTLGSQYRLLAVFTTPLTWFHYGERAITSSSGDRTPGSTCGREELVSRMAGRGAWRFIGATSHSNWSETRRHPTRRWPAQPASTVRRPALCLGEIRRQDRRARSPCGIRRAGEY